MPKKKGFTKIDDRLLEMLYANDNLSKREIRVILAILRFTSGYNRIEAELSVRFLEQETGIRFHHVSETLKSLQKKGIISIKQSSTHKQKRLIGINYRNDNQTVTSTGNGTVTPTGNGFESKKVTVPAQKGNGLSTGLYTTIYTTNINNIESSIKGQFSIDPTLLDLSFEFHLQQRDNGLYHPDFKNLSKNSKCVIEGAKTLKRLMEIDKRPLDEIKRVLDFILQDDFWRSQVVSLASLRRKSRTNGNYKYYNILNSREYQEFGKFLEGKVYSEEEIISRVKLSETEWEKFFEETPRGWRCRRTLAWI